MKTLRLWLLVLLALLLPLRGALAAAMVCAPAALTAPAEHEAHAHHGDGAGAHAAQHEPGTADGTDRCNVCSASCAATPLPQQPPGVAEPPGLAAAPYPDVAAAAPDFVSDGQDRPPRSR